MRPRVEAQKPVRAISAAVRVSGRVYPSVTLLAWEATQEVAEDR